VSATRSIPRTARRLSPGRMLMIIPCVLVAIGAAVLGMVAHVPDNQIAPGVHVGGLNLGGKNQEDARTALQQWADTQQARYLLLHFAPETGITREWKAQAQKIGLSIDVTATLEKALKEGRDNILGQVANVVGGNRAMHPVAPILAVDDAKLRAYLKEVAQGVNRKAKNAWLEPMDGGGFGTHHEAPGVELDMDASVKAVAQTWQDLYKEGEKGSKGDGEKAAPPATNPDKTPADAQASPTEESLPEAMLSVKAAVPEITSADLDQIHDMLAEFQTYFGSSSANRRSNIALAARKINGTLLKPGDIFSYNRVVGPRDEDAGFKEAPTYVQGKHVPGTGGGVCQVSSTLFNTAWTAGLKIVRRQNHSMPVGYLSHGRDATAVYGAIDMQFQNDTETPIYIGATAKGGVLHFSIWGKKTPGREVILQKGSESVVSPPVETHSDPRLPAGRRRVEEKGSPGISVTWYRIIKEDGKVVKKETYHSHYTAFPAIVTVGTGAPRLAPAKAGTSAPPATPTGATPGPTGATPGGVAPPGH